jgi:predicted transcriptional regulator
MHEPIARFRRPKVASISIKQKVLEAVQQLPPDATVEDAIERLYFLAKVERGVAQADAGETLTHEAARKRLLK